MKSLRFVLLVLSSLVVAGCGSDTGQDSRFTRQVEVFGLHIYATNNRRR